MRHHMDVRSYTRNGLLLNHVYQLHIVIYGMHFNHPENVYTTFRAYRYKIKIFIHYNINTVVV